MTSKIINTNKEKLETSNNISLEQLKDTNPKLYTHVKRALKAEKLNIDQKQEYLKLKQEKKDLTLDYYKITQAFAGEERLKQKNKELESILEEKSKILNELTKELSGIQETIQLTKQNIQNIEVKKLLLEYNEVKSMKERFLERKSQLTQEILSVEDAIEKSTKRPGKITPTVANQNLRKEIHILEAQIMEASKEIKEKEKEHLQAQYNYEEAKKLLKELQTPIISPILTGRNSVKRISFSKDTPALSENRSPVIKERNGSPTSPNKSGFVVLETPTSPDKRSSILNIVGKGMHETLTEQLAKALKGVGKPGQGMASKLLTVNRGEIIGKTHSK